MICIKLRENIKEEQQLGNSNFSALPVERVASAFPSLLVPFRDILLCDRSFHFLYIPVLVAFALEPLSVLIYAPVKNNWVNSPEPQVHSKKK